MKFLRYIGQKTFFNKMNELISKINKSLVKQSLTKIGKFANNQIQRCPTSTTTNETALMIHNYLTIRLTRQIKDNLLKMTEIKSSGQNLQLITNFLQLAEKLLFHMQVSNMLSRLFFMNYIFFQQLFYCKFIFVCSYNINNTGLLKLIQN